MLNEGMQSLLAEFLTVLVLRGVLCGMAYPPEFQLMYFAILGVIISEMERPRMLKISYQGNLGSQIQDLALNLSYL